MVGDFSEIAGATLALENHSQRSFRADSHVENRVICSTLRLCTFASFRSLLNRRGSPWTEEFNAKTQRRQDAKGESWHLGPTGHVNMCSE